MSKKNKVDEELPTAPVEESVSEVMTEEEIPAPEAAGPSIGEDAGVEEENPVTEVVLPTAPEAPEADDVKVEEENPVNDGVEEENNIVKGNVKPTIRPRRPMSGTWNGWALD